jgi:large subunit GTPase 1
MTSAVDSSVAGTEDASLMDTESDVNSLPVTGAKSSRLDKKFFGPGQSAGHLSQPFHYQYSDRGKQLTGRKLKTLTAIEKGVDPSELKMGSKKHFKANKKKAKKERAEYD